VGGRTSFGTYRRYIGGEVPVQGPSRGLGAFGNRYVLYAIGADYVALALPTEQAGQADET
jgi:hypothetical protein